MQGTRISAAIAISIFSAAALAQTDSMDAMAKQIDDLQVTRNARLNDIKMDDAAIDPKQKELNLWTNELSSGSLKKEEVRLKAQKDSFNAQANRLHAAIDNFNATCTGRMPMARYNACAQKKAGLQQWDARLHPQEMALHTAVANYNKRFDQAMARRNALKAEIEKWEAARAQHRQALAQAEARIKALIESMQARCKSVTGTPESIKYCNSIVWDNAARGLPVLGR